jgi:hypothetical protein
MTWLQGTTRRARTGKFLSQSRNYPAGFVSKGSSEGVPHFSTPEGLFNADSPQ